MSIELPPWLSWVASLAVGQHWPKGDEDGLRALGEAWEEAAQKLVDIGEEIGPATQGVLANVGGSVATEFGSFVQQLQTNLPDMATAAGQMGTLGKETGVQVEYAKYMILAQLAWLAVEIVDLSWWAPEAVPAAITAARVAVWMILRRLLTSIASGIGFMVGMDALIQAIQLLKGDRTHWDWQSTLSAVESGAISGAIGGIIGEGAGHFAPEFASNLIGKGVIGGVTGVASAAALTGIFGGSNDYGEIFAGGAIGAMLGGGHKGGEEPHVPEEHTPEIHVPAAVDLHLPGVDDAVAPPVDSAPHTPAESATGTPAESPAAHGSGTPAEAHGGTAAPAPVTATTGVPGHVEEGLPQSSPHVSESPASTTAAPTVHEAGGGLPGFETTISSPTPSTDAHVTPVTPVTRTTTASAPTPVEASPRAPLPVASTPTEAPGAHTATPPVTTTSSDLPHTEQATPPAEATATPPVTTTTTTTELPHTEQAPPVEQAPSPVEVTAAPHEPVVAPPTATSGPAPVEQVSRPAEVAPAPTPVTRPTEVPTPGEPVARPASAPPAISTERATPPLTTESGGGSPGPHETTPAPAGERHPATVSQELPAPPPERTATTAATTAGGPTPPPRTPPPRMKLDRSPRFVVRSGFDQRDFSHDGTPYTDLTVRIAFRGGDPADYADTFARAQQGVEQYFNRPGYRLPNGNRLHVTVETAAPHEQPHLTVNLVGDDHGMDQRNWPPHSSPISYAHEIGHQIGLRDEYADATNPNRANVTGSLLGNYHSPSEHGLPLGGLGDRHLQLLHALTGGGAPAPSHPAAHPGTHAGGADEVTPRMPDPVPSSASLHDHVPQSEWWKLYIDPKNHATALEKFPEDPGSFYDHDRSPGYQQGMVSAYKQFLGDPGAAHAPLTANSYQTIHDLAVSNLGRKIDWSGGRPTHFPLRGMQLSGDMFRETVDGRPLVYDLTTHDWSKKLTGPKPVTIMTNVMFKNHALSTNYGRGEAPGLVDSVFRRHYDTVGQPGVDDLGKLGSIASTIRALHVIHPFEDGNLRTNVQIVLPKLLLEQGFRPIVPDDMYTIFQGGHSVDQMVESLVRNGATEGLPHPVPDSVAPKAPVLPPDLVTAEDAGKLYGMPKGNFTKFQQIARQKNLVIDVRPTNPESVKWLDQGMLPKPMDIKAKTIGFLDTHLGADPEHQGLVGYFKPTLPTERPSGMDDSTWGRLQQRYHQRTNEFEQLAPKMQKLADQDKFHVEGGLVKGYNGEGKLTAITGDHDIFDISTPGGSRLTPNTYQHTIDDMVANNMAVVHGAHMYWPEPRSPFSQGIYEKIVTSHAEPDGEPLVRFRPGTENTTQLAWSRPPTDSGEAAPKAPGPGPATETADPHATQEARPGWQEARHQTPPVLRQHAWVDPVSDPNRTEMPQPEPQPTPHAEQQQEQHQPVVTPEPAPVEPAPTVEQHPATPEPAPAETPAPPQTPAPTPPPHDPAPPVAAPRYQRSLAGLKITADPGPGAVRDRIGDILGGHRDEQQVRQRLDVQLDPANFRTQHPQMVDGGWHFPITVDGKPYEVQIEATPTPWQGTPGTAKDSADIEASSTASYAPEPRKVDTTSTETGLDLGPSGSIPVNPHLNALVTGSLSVGGVSHAANTTVKSATEAPNKITLTGATDNHSSTFTYHVRVVDDHGTPLPHRADAPPITGEVKADIPRANPRPDPAAPPRTWNGWDPTPGSHPSGLPLTVTGLGGIRDAVFQHLPDEQGPDGLAHRPILDFLDPKHVVDGFEHASSWGLDSPQMTFSDGRTGYLRLTLHPQDSTVVDTVDHETSLGVKSSTEYSGSRGDSSARALGASGGASGEVWASDHDHETKWLTGTAGYNYSATTAHQAKLSSSLTAQSSHEQAGTSDLVATRVHFQIEVIKNHLAPGTDGLRTTRSETVGLRDPLPTPPPQADHVVVTMEHPIVGEALRLVPPGPSDGPVHEDAPQPPSAADLRTPQTAQRTSFLDVPGSAELEHHILTQAHQQAPGLLPPPHDAPGGPHRVGPQAVENLRTLHQQLSPSALRGGGGRLLDGSYRITLDSSHLPGFPGRSYEVTLQAHLDQAGAAHLGSGTSTSKSSLGVKNGADKQIGQGGKHTVSLAGNLRSSLNRPDTGRAFLNASADGSYSRTHQLSTGSDAEVKREFTLESPADSFRYPVSYDVRFGPEGGTHTPNRVPVAGGRPLVAEVRPPADPETPPPTHLPLTELPPAHLVTDVGGTDVFRQQAQAALGSAFAAKGDNHPPDLAKALDSLTGPDQLRGQISSSHDSWSNSGVEHVGSGRNRDAVGLSTRTVLSGFTYRETLPGQGKLSVETKSGSTTTVVDKWSGGVKGGLGPDFVRYPENPQGLHESTYQVRGGFKGKLSVGRDGNDSAKSQVTTSHKTTTAKGTWHVYEADAHVTTAGRVVDASGRTHHGQPQSSDHRVLVLLSDEDVRRLVTQGPAPAPQRHATMLDAGLPSGATVHFHSTDGILREIDAQLRGPQPEGAVPVQALPFAHTFSPDNLSAHYPDLVGKGILDHHVEETRSGRTITEVLVTGVPREPHWQDDGHRSESDTTRTVTTARTTKGNSGASLSAGADVNASASLRTPRAVDHLSNVNYGPSAGGEAGRTSGAESGVTAKTEHKTGKYGPGLGFSNGMDFHVVVTRRTEYGRFVNLPKGPGTVPHPGRVTAWVPESTTRPVDAPPLDSAPPDAGHQEPAPVQEPGPGLPGAIPLGPVTPTDAAHWQRQLDSGHDVVGFDHAGDLLANAGTALNTPRPWSDTLLGQAGQATTSLLGTGAHWISGALSTGAHAVLPKSLTDMGHRVVNSFVTDPRLDGDALGGDLQGEQRQPLPQRLGVRQAFSAQSLPSVLQQAKTAGGHYETVAVGADGATKLRVSVTPTGPAVEVGVRPNGEDEITATTEDASGTTATSTHSFSAGLANASLTTNKPVVTLPFNGPKLTGEGSSDRTGAPVTRTPGEPSTPQPPAALPHGLTPGAEPGKAELKGPQGLMRQPVRVTVQKTDVHGPYGAAVPTDGHLYYWAAKPAAEPDTLPVTPRPTAETDAPPVTPRPTAEPDTPPVTPRPTTEPDTPTVTPQPATPDEPPSHPAPVEEEPVVIRLSPGNGNGPALPPEQRSALDSTAERLAALAAEHGGEGEPPLAVTVTATAAVHQNGVPHYGRSLSLAARRARAVGDALNQALGEHGTHVEITLAPQVSQHVEDPEEPPYVLVATPRAPRPPEGPPPPHPPAAPAPPVPPAHGGHQPPPAAPHVTPRTPEEVHTVLAIPPRSEPIVPSAEDRQRGEALASRYDRVSLIDPGSDGTGHQTGYLRFLDGLAQTGYRGEVHLTYARTKTPVYARAFGHRASLDDPELSYGLFHDTWHGGYKGLDVVMHPVGPAAHPPFRGAPEKLAGDIRTYWTHVGWRNSGGPTTEQLNRLGGWQKKAFQGDQLQATRDDFYTYVMRRATDATVIGIAPGGGGDLHGGILKPGPRTLTVFAAFDAPHDVDPASFFSSTPLREAIATMTHTEKPDVLILEPFLWDKHDLQIHHGDNVTDLGRAIRDNGAFPAYHWHLPAEATDIRAHVDQHWTPESSNLEGAKEAVSSLLAQASEGHVTLATAYYGDSITGALPHDTMLRTLGTALADAGKASGKPSALVLLGGSTDGGLADSAAAALRQQGHRVLSGPHAWNSAQSGDVVLLELGRVPSDIMTSFERHSTLVVTEGASTWQEILSLGTPGISARPDGDTRPWTQQVPGTDPTVGELVAEASRQLMAGNAGQLARFISALDDPTSPVRSWVDNWSAALQNPAGDQVRAAIDHLVGLSDMATPDS